nr:GNAT family N-acetyltransferase [Rhodoferax sp. BLA1]
MRQAGYLVGRYFCFGNWYLQLAGRSFAEYQSSLPSALRHSITRGQRRLDKQGPWRIDIQRQPDGSLEAAIQDFVTVYQKSWKGAEPNSLFIPALARTAAAQGWLRLGVLRLDGQAIAAQLWLVKSGKASIFKLAYVTGFERFSVGSVLTAALMQHVIDVDQVQEVDYLTGDDAYKRDWMSHRRERWGLVAFDWRTPAGLWAGCRHALGLWLKRRNPDDKVSIRVCL